MISADLILNVAKFLLNAGQLIPTVISTVEEATPLAKKLVDMLHSDKPPTQAEWDDLHAFIDEKTADILKPLPPA